MTGEMGAWLYRSAAMLVRPVAGRVLGIIPIAGPLAGAMYSGWQYGASPWLVTWVLLSSIPALALAFGLHEAGHLVLFRLLGLRGHLTYRPPIDLRSVPVGASYEHSTGVRLIARAAAGWLANIVAAGVLAAVAICAGGPWAIWCWWAAAWQGVSALTATAWAAHAPLTDGASLSSAVRVRDRISANVACLKGRLSIRLAVTIVPGPEVVKPSAADEGWWLWLSGLDDAEVGKGRLLSLPAEPGELLLYARSGCKQLSTSITGTPTGRHVRIVTRGGTVTDIATKNGGGSCEPTAGTG